MTSKMFQRRVKAADALLDLAIIYRDDGAYQTAAEKLREAASYYELAAKIREVVMRGEKPVGKKRGKG